MQTPFAHGRSIYLAENAESILKLSLGSVAEHTLSAAYFFSWLSGHQTLKSLLNFRAQVLTALGKQDEAQAKSEEANKL